MLLSVLSTLPQQKHHPRRKLSNYQAAQLQQEYRLPGVTTTALAKKYGVSQQTAHRIATGVYYSELPTWGPKLQWPPKVHGAGMPDLAELRDVQTMLQIHPGHWAMVKRTVRRSPLEPWQNMGLEAELRKDAYGWGVWVRWPEAKSGASVA